MVVAAFVAPYLLEATARFVAPPPELPDVRLGLITGEPVGPDSRRRCASSWPGTGGSTTRSTRVRSPRRSAASSGQMGRVERLVGALEQLQVPLAQVREALGIEGMDVSTALNVRDKSRMKAVLRGAACRARGTQLVHQRRRRHRASPTRSGSRWSPSRRPVPARRRPTGSTTRDMLRGWLAAVPPGADAPRLLEEFLVGEEHTFDSVTVGGETVWSSIADYIPPPLEVLRNPWIQWTVVLPRDITGPRVRRHPRGRPRRAARAGRRATRSPTWSGSAGPTARSPSPRWRPGRPGRS